jgi:hypothetical protein
MRFGKAQPFPERSPSRRLYAAGFDPRSKNDPTRLYESAQTQPHFKVFYWARSDQWQTDVPFGSLGSYLGTTSAHRTSYQTLGVWNSTYQISSTQWRNEALLWNRAAGRWDLFYRYDYAGTLAQQTGGWTGSWGPIVETFQSLYVNTNRFGALNTMLISRNSSGAWGHGSS